MLRQHLLDLQRLLVSSREDLEQLRKQLIELELKTLTTAKKKPTKTVPSQKPFDNENENLIEPETDLSSIELGPLAIHMSKNINVEDRRYHLKLYKNCFIGHQAVTFISSYLNCSRSDAIIVAQKMIAENFITHVGDNPTFQDDYSFYRFTSTSNQARSFKIHPGENIVIPESIPEPQVAATEMEGWLEMFTLGFSHKKYFKLTGNKLFFYDKPTQDGGKELGFINLVGCIINEIKTPLCRFEILNCMEKEIFTINDLTKLPAMTILSKIKGSNCWLQTFGSNKMIEFTDWLITFEYHNLLKLEVSPDSFFEERRKQILGVEKESPPPSAVQPPNNAASPSSQPSSLVKSPLYNHILQMKEILGNKLTDQHADEDLMRFLKARKGNPVDAATAFGNFIDWAMDYKPTDIKFQDIFTIAQTGLAHFHYTDKNGAPCLVVHSRLHKKKERDLQQMIKFIIFMVENGIKSTKKLDNKLSVIFDYSQFNSSNSDLELARELIGLMNKYFPERLGCVFLINYPWAISIVLSLVEPMLDPDTRKKINLVKKKEDLLNFFDKEHLLPIHGGSSSYKNQRFLLGFETINQEFAESIEILGN